MAKKENVKDKSQKSHYFKDMKAELKKVIWPSPKQLINNTLAVIVFVLIVAVIVFVLDVCFESLSKYAIAPLQEKVQSAYTESHPSEENTESEEDSNSEEDANSEESTDVDENSEESNTENDETNIEVETTANVEE
jgi:preprotein translocase subunit SecE